MIYSSFISIWIETLLIFAQLTRMKIGNKTSRVKKPCWNRWETEIVYLGIAQKALVEELFFRTLSGGRGRKKAMIPKLADLYCVAVPISYFR